MRITSKMLQKIAEDTVKERAKNERTILAAYHDLFGGERVLVLPYEMLRSEPRAFADAICDFAGATRPTDLASEPANVGLSVFSAALKRPLNRLFVRDTLNPTALLPFPRANALLRALFASLDRHLPEAVRRPFDERARQRIESVVQDRYRQSNRKTQALTGLDLQRWGYPS